jgi:hypothetical protein
MVGVRVGPSAEAAEVLTFLFVLRNLAWAHQESSSEFSDLKRELGATHVCDRETLRRHRRE